MRSFRSLERDTAKLLGVTISLAAVAGVHALVPVGTHPLHVIHVGLGALHFVPVAAAAIWFGVPGGLGASSAAAGLYLGSRLAARHPGSKQEVSPCPPGEPRTTGFARCGEGSPRGRPSR